MIYHPTEKQKPLHFSGLSILLNKSPAHYAAAKFFREDRDSQSFKIGRAFHYLLLECTPEERRAYFDKFWVMPEGLTLRHKKGKEFAATHDPLLRLTPAVRKQHRVYTDMIAACEASPLVAKFLTTPRELREVKLEWYDPFLGLDCAGRADLILLEENQRYRIVDFKTTEDCSVQKFGRSVEKYMYHMQAAMYREGLQFEYGLDYLPSYSIVAIEKVPPFALQVYSLSESTLEVGGQLYKRAAEIYSGCLKTGQWPSYNTESIVL